jgi:hypothetical protein
MGTIASLLPSRVPVRAPEVDIAIRNQLESGIPVVVTLVTLTNRASASARLTYIYQDAAYMWFPDGDQRNTESMRIKTSTEGYGRYVNVVSAGATAPGFWQFAGTFNREHGVIAGILSLSEGEIAGISGDYVGLGGVEIDGSGFYLGRANYRAADIPRVETEMDVRQNRYINRFIAHDFGELQPGESKTFTLFRIMAVLPPEQRTEDGMQAWVSSQVRAMYDRETARTSEARNS